MTRLAFQFMWVNSCLLTKVDLDLIDHAVGGFWNFTQYIQDGFEYKSQVLLLSTV